jgi:AhpD family alkylhydroperoxidase
MPALAALSPVALESALHLDGALRKSSLSAKEIEAIKLAVSEQSGCDYCLAAHSLMGKKVGLSAQAIDGVRHDRPRAMTAWMCWPISPACWCYPRHRPADVVERVRAVYSDAQIVDTLLAVTAITFTNLFNRVNDTVLDFPPAP